MTLESCQIVTELACVFLEFVNTYRPKFAGAVVVFMFRNVDVPIVAAEKLLSTNKKGWVYATTENENVEPVQPALGEKCSPAASALGRSFTELPVAGSKVTMP